MKPVFRSKGLGLLRLTSLPEDLEAFGDAVYSGGRLLAKCPGADGPLIAKGIVALSDESKMLRASRFDVLEAKVDSLEALIADLLKENAELIEDAKKR